MAITFGMYSFIGSRAYAEVDCHSIIKSAQERVARVRACNSLHLKLVGIYRPY